MTDSTGPEPAGTLPPLGWFTIRRRKVFQCQPEPAVSDPDATGSDGIDSDGLDQAGPDIATLYHWILEQNRLNLERLLHGTLPARNPPLGTPRPITWSQPGPDSAGPSAGPSLTATGSSLRRFLDPRISANNSEEDPVGFSLGRLTGLGLSGRLLLCLLLFTLALLDSQEEEETIFMTYPPFSTALIFSPLQLTLGQLKTAVLGIAPLRFTVDNLKAFQVSSNIKI